MRSDIVLKGSTKGFSPFGLLQHGLRPGRIKYTPLIGIVGSMLAGCYQGQNINSITVLEGADRFEGGYIRGEAFAGPEKYGCPTCGLVPASLRPIP